ncbi:MG2 domain-containing protein [Blastopirellula marina]|uniref:Alpha-2-macroglobulin bait region domain-containing protein n=1 Tax=Blastopirellula marina TaxID=124 RepID=A0A2S8GHU1_9BACT|nr:MG2 domain-containing protein [Blastopirellula marina]PQO44022.1 hypothetical protein C5Y93_21000 [Blastopirellula marina]
MTDHEENRQQLLELIYGLLPSDEASELASRIGRDPELARAYAEMKEQTDLLASAVRVNVPPMPDFAAWKKLAQEEDRVERSRAAQGFVRTMQALTALAAAVLILVSGAAVMYSNSPPLAKATSNRSSDMADAVTSDNAVAAAPAAAMAAAIELEVSGPRVLSSEVSNRFAVSVRNELPIRDEAEISYNFISSEGETVAAGKQLANNGVARIALPAEKARPDLKLQVMAQQGRESAEVETPQLASAPPASVTSLSLDRPLVRGGDTLRWRSNTLTSQTQQPVNGPVEFEILDPYQQKVVGFDNQGETRDGVAASTWSLPRDAVAGNYSLIAKNAAGVADVTRFQVDPLAPPVWNARLQFARDYFEPGEEISASLQLNSPTGQPLANQKLQMRQIVAGRIVAEPQEIETKEDGQAEVKLRLAEIAAPNVTQHLYFSNADQSWAYAAPIPLEPQSVDVNFFPEGGTLVAGLSNRVFFHATDANGKPVELKGAVVNSRDEVVATTETEYRGRGQFDFIPLPQQNYRFTAALGDNQVVADLPPTSEAAVATLKVADSVVDADQPLEVEVVSRDADQRYGLAYYNNGALVTQQFFAVPQTLKSTRVRLDVPAEIAGAGEVTLYAADEAGQVTPLAERMVFRRPEKKLAIETDDLQTEYAANDHVNIKVATKDEAGQPAPAALGVAVVNESAFAHTLQDSPTLVASQLLTKRLQRPEELKDPQALLGDDPQSERQLDYVMATDGWRQFVKADAQDMFAQAPGNRQAVREEELARISEYAKLSSVPYNDAPSYELDEQPILLVKNKKIAAVRDFDKQTPVAAPVTATSSTGINLAPWALLAAFVTTLGLAVLVLMRSAGSPWFWGPSIAVTSLAAIALAVAQFAPLQSQRVMTSNPVAMQSVPDEDVAPMAPAPVDAQPTITASAMSAAGEAELEELSEEKASTYGGMKLDKNAATAQGSLLGNAADEGLTEATPVPEMIADPYGAEMDQEARKLAESRSAVRSRMQDRATPLAAPMEIAPAAEGMTPASPTPKLEAKPYGVAGEKTRQMRIGSDQSLAKKESTSRPAATMPSPAEEPAMESIEMSDLAGQSRFSMGDQKSNNLLGMSPERRGGAAAAAMEDELLMRNQAIGTAEYGLRQAASQQAGLAQQAQQMQIPNAAGGFGGGVQPNVGMGGVGAQQQAEQAPPLPMMMSRGAAPASKPAADAAQPGKQEAESFFYRAYAYGDPENQDKDGLASNQPAPETIYWAPLVQTDADGQATLSFQLPPTPGKYRITIDAVGDGRIGSVRNSFDTVPVSESATPPPTKKAGK